MSVDYGTLVELEVTSADVLGDQLAKPISMPMDTITSDLEFLDQFAAVAQPQDASLDILSADFGILEFTNELPLDPIGESVIASMDWLATLESDVPGFGEVAVPVCFSLPLRQRKLISL
jgi:hypothetical protein